MIKTILKYIFIFILICITICSGFFFYIFLSAPDFNENLLYKKEVSKIYDKNNETITTIGTENRVLVSYEDVPQVLIDAIISTEDQNFFEHKGVDFPYLVRAGLNHITGKDTGGASTLTMQLSKNCFTSTKSKGFDGIVRKFTDVYLSLFKIEKKYSKKEIFEFYINAPYLGAGTYGIKSAAQTYFGKDVQDLNLVESAFIAGLFQAPGEYDPYVNPEKANSRKNHVINLMYKHKYISEHERNLAKNVNITDILLPLDTSKNPYQGYIDTVIEEVIERTGCNPYIVSMDIYTAMDRSKQDVINNFYATYGFRDDTVNVGAAEINNNNGEIVAVGAGRNRNGILTLNYATQIKRHPGSTAKPLFDYGPGIEYYNWSTYTPFSDSPVKYTNGGTMRNWDGRYKGFMTMYQALSQSRNTSALRAFQSIDNSLINKFVTGLGITPEYLYANSEYINEAHAIGGFTGVSPVELAAAYQAFGNGGIYNEPHTVRKIVYKNQNRKIEEELSYESHRAMKATTAYMITYILQSVTPSNVKVSNTQLACKTGTSSYDDITIQNAHVPSNTIRDAWTVTYSADYTVSIWYGYDTIDSSHYITFNTSSYERKLIQAALVNKLIDSGSYFTRPAGIVSSRVVYGSNPPLLPSASSTNVQTHLFIEGTQPIKRAAYIAPQIETVDSSNENNE